MDPSLQRKFHNILHDPRHWKQSPETVSGRGSSLEMTAMLRAALPSLYERLQIKSVLDLPCGDFNWMQQVLSNLGEKGPSYIGADIVQDIVTWNRQRFPDIDFRVLDLCTDKLPKVDLVLVRDCFIHLNFRQIIRALKNIRRAGIKYLLVTDHIRPDRKNVDLKKIGRTRRINFSKRPFNFPPPSTVIREDSHSEGESDVWLRDRYLSLWEVSKLPLKKVKLRTLKSKDSKKRLPSGLLPAEAPTSRWSAEVDCSLVRGRCAELKVDPEWVFMQIRIARGRELKSLILSDETCMRLARLLKLDSPDTFLSKRYPWT
jgi:SAM-dependent methyltransferase